MTSSQFLHLLQSPGGWWMGTRTSGTCGCFLRAGTCGQTGTSGTCDRRVEPARRSQLHCATAKHQQSPSDCRPERTCVLTVSWENAYVDSGLLWAGNITSIIFCEYLMFEISWFWEMLQSAILIGCNQWIWLRLHEVKSQIESVTRHHCWSEQGSVWAGSGPVVANTQIQI